jgi:hypothetical protein
LRVQNKKVALFVRGARLTGKDVTVVGRVHDVCFRMIVFNVV